MKRKQIITVSCSRAFDASDPDDHYRSDCDAVKIATLARKLGFTVMTEEDNLARGDRENSNG